MATIIIFRAASPVERESEESRERQRGLRGALTRNPKGDVAMIAGLAMQINLHAVYPSALAPGAPDISLQKFRS